MKLLVVRRKGAEYVMPGTPGKVEIIAPMPPGSPVMGTSYIVEIVEVEAAFELSES